MPRVRLFASLREIAGASEMDVEGATVGEVVDVLSQRYGRKFADVVQAGSVVVDGERASSERALSGTEEVALLPPFAGG